MSIEVKIEQLAPSKVAFTHFFGPSPETVAGKLLTDMARTHGLDKDPAAHRIFGFNNPNPSAGSPNYGYEFWIMVNDDFSPEGVEVKDFPGGLYAVSRCEVRGGNFEVIGNTWQALVAWRESSEYTHGTHQWLEEHIDVFGEPVDGFTLDLFLPIVK